VSASRDAATVPHLGVTELRARLGDAKRIVIKIGSKSLAGDAWDRMAAEIAKLEAARRQVVVVSSGAIALGVQRLGLPRRPKDIAWLQAAAAAGQSALMQRWEAALGPLGMTAAQVLLTHADLADRTRTNNARAALEALLEAGAVPIINENDAVSVEEIKFGDNDQLASMVVPLVSADLLLLLSDVEGLLDEKSERVPLVRDIAEATHLAGGSRSGVGTGGMTSKLEAARRATLAGANVVIALAKRPGVVGEVLAGRDVGTLFPAVPNRLNARKHWIAFTLRPRGALVLDDGAAAAVRENRSVLSIGVLGVRGAFSAGDSVSLFAPSGTELARGLVRVSSVEAAAHAGRRDETGRSETLVHRSDLVVLPER
jgi:glutamate 5-kinase